MRTPKTRHEAVHPLVFAYLLHGELAKSDGDDAAWLDAFMLTTDRSRVDELRGIWDEVRADALAAWMPAGTRPFGWWLFDAPRWRGPYPGRAAALAARLQHEEAEPRLRLGGIGTPAYEVLNIWPRFRAGVPMDWVSPFDEAYFNGRHRDVHGHRIGTGYHEGHFAGVAPRADDPPRFESEASYLDRHGLLTASERRRLTENAFRPVRLPS